MKVGRPRTPIQCIAPPPTTQPSHHVTLTPCDPLRGLMERPGAVKGLVMHTSPLPPATHTHPQFSALPPCRSYTVRHPLPALSREGNPTPHSHSCCIFACFPTPDTAKPHISSASYLPPLTSCLGPCPSHSSLTALRGLSVTAFSVKHGAKFPGGVGDAQRCDGLIGCVKSCDTHP